MGFEKFPSPEQQKEAGEEKKATLDDVMNYFYNESDKAQEDESVENWKELGNYVQNGNYEIPLRFLETRLEDPDVTQQYRSLSECLREKVLKNEKPYNKEEALENFIDYVKESKEASKDDKDEVTLKWFSDLDRMTEEAKRGYYDYALLEAERIAGISAEALSRWGGEEPDETRRENLKQLKRARKLIQFFSKESNEK